MPGPMPRRDQDRVETDVARDVMRICREPGFRCGNDPPLLSWGDGFGRIVEPDTRFDLDEDQNVAAASDKVDLANAAAKALGDHAIALCQQERGGAAFR